jgi:2,4-dienoyl-CoA reductase-like NADH-dependent reductase (Old Yellow Enzyme family)
MPVAPTALAFKEGDLVPEALTVDKIKEIIAQFRQAARRALAAGFEVIELHGAHGYLINEFLSPLSNHRTDEYGGDFHRRMRFLLDVIQAVRMEWQRS